MGNMSIKTVFATAILVLGFAVSTPAMAEDAGKANAFSAFDAVATTDLNKTRGMNNHPDWEDLEGALQAVMDGNTAIDNGSIRTNTIEASFNGASGIATVVQNAGNNVIIQTATMVTVNYN